MRILFLILLAALASPAAAQTDFDTLHAENRLAARQEQARQRALAADREAMVLESRARTATALAGLRVPPPAVEVPLDPTLAAQIEAVADLRARELAESNARILAIEPANKD